MSEVQGIDQGNTGGRQGDCPAPRWQARGGRVSDFCTGLWLRWPQPGAGSGRAKRRGSEDRGRWGSCLPRPAGRRLVQGRRTGFRDRCLGRRLHLQSSGHRFLLGERMGPTGAMAGRARSFSMDAKGAFVSLGVVSYIIRRRTTRWSSRISKFSSALPVPSATQEMGSWAR